MHDCYEDGESELIKEVQQSLISNLNEEITKVEQKIEDIIESEDSISNNYKLILSIRGVGKILGFYLIGYTVNFTSFANARSFACFAGIAPFSYSSGIAKGTPRVHPFANKMLKALLNLAAMSAIKYKGEYLQYFNKRVNELGKNKMSTLNIIRNKIVYRVFAVVQRQTPYVDLLKFAV